MKNRGGFTLVELLVVVSIIAILAVALGFQFTGWFANYAIESEVKQIQADLMNARIQAMQRNHCRFIVFTTTSYSIYEDTNDNGVYDAGIDPAPAGVKNPVVLPKLYPLTAALTVKMDTKGLIYPGYPDETVTDGTIQVTTAAGQTPDYNCLTVAKNTRINIGSMVGGICVEK